MISIKYTTRGLSRGKFILKLTITFDYMRKFYLVSITFPYVEVYTDIRPCGKFEKFH